MVRSRRVRIQYGMCVNAMLFLAIASLPMTPAIKLNSGGEDLTRRTLHILNSSDTLKEELEQYPAIALDFKIGAGCVNHFYHMILNAALPLYTKLVRPFVQAGIKPPHRRLYVNSMGGTIQTLQEIFPEFEFVFEPWVPSCCKHKVGNKMVRTCEGSDSRLRDIPLFTLHSDGITYGDSPNARSQDYSQLLQEFREHILEAAGPQPQGPLKHVYVSRRENYDFNASVGILEYGCETRCLDEVAEQNLIQAMNATPAGVQVAHLSGLPFFSQVRIFRKANLLVGAHGAAFVHCLWMPRNSSIIEINRVDNKNFFKWLCNDLLKLGRYNYLAEGKMPNMLVNISSFTAEFHDLLQ